MERGGSLGDFITQQAVPDKESDVITHDEIFQVFPLSTVNNQNMDLGKTQNKAIELVA